LREYSIPHLRKAGRISIPEDSFDRIREARDLHKEGLGTESVRRQLREDTGELDRSLGMLHQTLESLRDDIRERPAADEVALSPTLRTIMARQSLIMSVMFNLTGMMEDLLLASGKPRKPLFDELDVRDALPARGAQSRLGTPGSTFSATREIPQPGRGSIDRSPAVGSTGFGVLGRRRRSVLAILAALLLVACLSWAGLAMVGAGNDGTSVSRVAKTANGPPGGSKALAAPDPRERESMVEVPDVSGRSLEGAVRIISDAGFEVAAIETRTSREGPGKAIGTEPPAGVPAKPGAPVILTMGGGPDGIPSGARDASVSATASASASAGYAN
jgi:PASTA domain